MGKSRMALGRPDIQHLSAGRMGRVDCDIRGDYFRNFYAGLFALRGRELYLAAAFAVWAATASAPAWGVRPQTFLFFLPGYFFSAGTFVFASQTPLVHIASDAAMGKSSCGIRSWNCFHGFVSRPATYWT